MKRQRNRRRKRDRKKEQRKKITPLRAFRMFMVGFMAFVFHEAKPPVIQLHKKTP